MNPKIEGNKSSIANGFSTQNLLKLDHLQSDLTKFFKWVYEEKQKLLDTPTKVPPRQTFRMLNQTKVP